MYIELPTIEYNDRKWAVVNVTWFAMSRIWVLQLMSEGDKDTISIAEEDYDALMAPENNPAQRFYLQEQTEEETDGD